MTKEITENRKGFIQGFICCVCIAINLEGCVNTPIMEMFAAGVGNMSVKTMEKYGVDAHDIELIKKHWKSLKNKYP